MSDNPDDIRRAKAGFLAAAKDAHHPPEWDTAFPQVRALWISIARAIRENDEAAGLVLVPRVATEGMVNAAKWGTVPTSSFNDVWTAMIAAHEGGRDE